MIIKFNFQLKNISQSIHMDTRKQCWELSRGIFAWSRKSLPPMSERFEKTLLSESNIPPKMFLRLRRLPYWQARGGFKIKKLKSFVTRKILHKTPYGHQKTVLTAQPRNFWLKSEIFTLNVRMLWRNSLLSHKCSNKMFLWKRRLPYWQPRGASLKKSRNLFVEWLAMKNKFCSFSK